MKGEEYMEKKEESIEFLYHYTSLENLALILKNKTIKFNNLLYVDDMEEAETEDMGLFGRFVYVSCWTMDSEESIPMWNLYTPNMRGVRIKLPVNPFKKYHFNKGEFYFMENVDTYIDIQKLYVENKANIVTTEPHLVKVKYTEKHHKLFPKVRIESYDGAVNDFLRARSLDELSKNNIEVKYSFEDVGRYKRKQWKFQKEWRYIINVSPMGLKEIASSSFETQQEMIRRIENRNLEPPYKQIFLNLDDIVLENMEVMFGPKMSISDKVMAEALLEKFCPKGVYKDSNLKIR